jgi:hypothetical protein
MNEIPKVVFARSGRPAIEPAPASAKTEPSAEAIASWRDARVASGPLSDEIARLKRGDGNPIFAHGGATFAQSLARANLFDEYACPCTRSRSGAASRCSQRSKLEACSRSSSARGSMAARSRLSIAGAERIRFRGGRAEGRGATRDRARSRGVGAPEPSLISLSESVSCGLLWAASATRSGTDVQAPLVGG